MKICNSSKSSEAFKNFQVRVQCCKVLPPYLHILAPVLASRVHPGGVTDIDTELLKIASSNEAILRVKGIGRCQSYGIDAIIFNLINSFAKIWQASD